MSGIGIFATMPGAPEPAEERPEGVVDFSTMPQRRAPPPANVDFTTIPGRAGNPPSTQQNYGIDPSRIGITPQQMEQARIQSQRNGPVGYGGAHVRMPGSETPSALETLGVSGASAMIPGSAPYLQALGSYASPTMMAGAPFNVRVAEMKARQERGERANPRASQLGFGAGLIGAALSPYMRGAKGALVTGATSGATQWGTGLEDTISDLSPENALKLGLQTVTGTAIAAPFAYASHLMAGKMPQDIRELGRTAGVTIPANINWRGAQNTIQSTANRLYELSGGRSAVDAARSAAEAFSSLVRPATSSKVMSPAQRAAQRLSNVSDEASFMPAILSMEAPEFRAFARSLQARAPEKWEALKDGFIDHLNNSGRFRFSLFNKAWDEAPDHAKSALLAGREAVAPVLGAVRRLGQRVGPEIDRMASAGAPKSPSLWQRTKNVAAATSAGFPVSLFSPYAGQLAAGLAGGLQVAREALNTAPVRAVTSRVRGRNVSHAPEVQRALNAARTGVRAAARGATQTASELGDWFKDNFGFEEGGRVAYRNGGKVSGIEPLVQALMRKYKQARSMETKSTQPLLDTPDQAIVKALSVAKKAI